MAGFVSIVGAGPWDPYLLTLAGRDRLQRAEVVIADYLVNPALLLWCPPDAEIHQRIAGPRGGALLDQEKINALLVEKARAGRYVVRLKGGDPCMFGRGGEEAEVLREHGIDFELVPGVSSPIAAPEAAGIPVTHRHHTPAVTFVSGYEAYEKAGLAVAWEHLARSAGTIVLMMSVRNAASNARRLIEAGRDPSTPAAAVRWGTRGIQQTIVGNLGGIADRIREAGLRAPAVLVVGDVVDLRSKIGWLERRPLFGRRVVITRSRDRSETLGRLLAGRGADVVPIPCQEVAPPEDLSALDRAVSSLEDHDGVILTSPNGVATFFGSLERTGLDLRSFAGKSIAVVGDSTAGACRARGLHPDVVADDPHSEGLAQALRGRDLLRRRWLHVRGADARPVLRDAIEAAGGTYTAAIAYRTIVPALPPMLVRSLLPPAQGGEGFDAVCFASGTAARNFVSLLSRHLGEAEARAALERAEIVTIGPITTHAVEALGLSVAAEARVPSDEALADALQHALGPNAG